MSFGTVIRTAILAVVLTCSASAQESEAERLLRAGRVAEALPVARVEAESAPDDLDAQERYIDALLTMGLIGVADEAYRGRLDAQGSANAWYLFGRVLPDAQLAEAAYKRALEEDPNHARALMGLGAVYRATGNAPAAERYYTLALERDATLSEAYSGLLQIQLGTGRPAEALATARAARAANPSDPDAYLALAALEPERALDTLQTGVTRAGTDPRLHASLAEAYLDRGQGAQAKLAAERALDISPSFADPALSLLFAEEMARGALDADGYHGLLGTRLVEQDDPFDALARYTDLIERYPESALTYLSRARVRAGQGNLDGAIADLANAIGNDPQNLEAQATLGLLLLRAERLSEAIAVLDRVVTSRPGDATLAIALSRAQEQSGDRAAALATIATAREARPLHVEAALEDAKLRAMGGDREGAYEVLVTVAREVPDERLILALAAASKELGRMDEAARWLDGLAARSGNEAYRELAARLRSGQ